MGQRREGSVDFPYIVGIPLGNFLKGSDEEN